MKNFPKQRKEENNAFAKWLTKKSYKIHKRNY